MIRSKKKETALLVVAVLLVGVVFGWLGANVSSLDSTSQLQRRYNLLSKRILIENPNDIIIDFQGLKKDLQQYIDQNVGQDNVSLYFEYLPTGSSVGINEDKEIIGASLLKLPVVMKTYKLSEQGRIDLDQEVKLEKEWLNQDYGELYKKGTGYALTTRDAVRYALEQSDNTAVLLLVDSLNSSNNSGFSSVLDFVDVNFDTTVDERVLIGSQSYSSILKCLYFSCYLDKDDSQEILGYLANSEANHRLQKYIPPNVQVAHKIGAFGDEAQSDCGITYLEKRNYLLCVMVLGEDTNASEHIAELSRITYDRLASSGQEE